MNFHHIHAYAEAHRPYRFNILDDIINPLEGGSTVTEPHFAPEVDWVQHQVPHTHPQLVSHREPLRGPHKLPLAPTQSLQNEAKGKIPCTIPGERMYIILSLVGFEGHM